MDSGQVACTLTAAGAEVTLLRWLCNHMEDVLTMVCLMHKVHTFFIKGRFLFALITCHVVPLARIAAATLLPYIFVPVGK